MTTDDIAARLSAPFDPGRVEFKPQMVKGNRALAMAYIDARTVMIRLDEVMGIDGWEDNYTVMADGNVECRLTLLFPGKPDANVPDGWTRQVTKCDVGGPSDQPDGGDRMKAAYSDALKRAAVKFGVGRYLYDLPAQWCDYDPQKKQFASTPTLPGPKTPKPKPASEEVKKQALAKLTAAAEQGPDALDGTYRALSAGEKASIKDCAELPGIRKIADNVLDRELKLLADWLGTEPDIDKFNVELEQNVFKLPPKIKEAAKAECKVYADNCGWTWSGQHKKYVA